jgi:hypothetical protein
LNVNLGLIGHSLERDRVLLESLGLKIDCHNSGE